MGSLELGHAVLRLLKLGPRLTIAQQLIICVLLQLLSRPLSQIHRWYRWQLPLPTCTHSLLWPLCLFWATSFPTSANLQATPLREFHTTSNNKLGSTVTPWNVPVSALSIASPWHFCSNFVPVTLSILLNRSQQHLCQSETARVELLISNNPNKPETEAVVLLSTVLQISEQTCLGTSKPYWLVNCAPWSVLDCSMPLVKLRCRQPCNTSAV